MSSILKALKKLEEEKSARRAGIDVARVIVKSVPVRSGRRRWLFPVSVSGAAITAALLTYVLVGGVREHKQYSGQPAASRSQSEVRQKSAEVDVVMPGISGKKTHPVGELQKTGVSRPLSKSVSKVPQKNYSPSKSALSHPAGVPVGEKTPGEGPPRQKQVQLPGVNSSAPLQQSVLLPLPALRVTGIAWNKDNSERFAVVNGVSVSEGMTVSGAVVNRIFQDKVRFSFENRTFDVAVGNEMR